jgi:hypothetical protein
MFAHLLRSWRSLNWPVRVAITIVAVGGLVAGVLTVLPDPPRRVTVSGNQALAPPPAHICNSPMLDSPWHYDGAPGMYTKSGTPAGLPTFGAPGTDFPGATKVIVVPAGDNSRTAGAGKYQVSHAIVYFEPGLHKIQNGMWVGLHSAYVGGLDATHGKAILDGVDGATGRTGDGGARLTTSIPTRGHVVGNTYEYLTVENYAAPQNGEVMGEDVNGYPEENDVFKYDTIGPNQYGYSYNAPPGYGESSGGGYGVGAGSYSIIEYNCITQNAQGGINSSGAADLNISNNEISRNGLGEYPDTSGRGASPHACGCSGGMKVFLSINAKVVNNWIHDNYNVGVWFDYENTGANISHNYISSNWSRAIEYEAGYNANISDNTLTGNGWASDGRWPAGYHGRACFNGVSCRLGNGPSADNGFPFATIYTPNSMGNTTLGADTINIPNTVSVPGCPADCTIKSHYSGHLYIENNNIYNDFGGVMVYADLNRYPGDINSDETCSTQYSFFGQENDPTYYTDRHLLVTNSDTTIASNTVNSTNGTEALCKDFNTSGNSTYDNQPQTSYRAPLVGELVYDQKSGKYLGRIAKVTSDRQFTLNDSPGKESGVSLVISKNGGCGPADYYGASRPGQTSGNPSAHYWDNCLYGAKNYTVRGNQFYLDTSTVTPCTSSNGCGGMAAMAFRPGIPALMHFWWNYTNLIADATSALNNVWSDNSYVWKGGGSGGWVFMAGNQGNAVSQSVWQDTYHQDSGSTFN